jgi:hypothetical protein
VSMKTGMAGWLNGQPPGRRPKGRARR